MTVKAMLIKSLRPLLGSAILVALILAGCAYEGTRKLPGVYRIDIQQGNVVDQEMLDQLELGMDMNQVRHIMGTPVIADPFHQYRWEYLFMYSEGGKRREQRHVTLFFDENKKLEAVGGNVVASERDPDDLTKEPSRTVEVPLSDDNEGFFATLFGALPFVGDDDGPTPKRQPPPQEPPKPPGVETDSLSDKQPGS